MSNGHSTLLEIYKCLTAEKTELSILQLTYVAVDRYNNTINSVTGKSPNDIFFNRINASDFDKLIEARSGMNRDLRNLIKRNTKEQNNRMNIRRSSPKKLRRVM